MVSLLCHGPAIVRRRYLELRGARHGPTNHSTADAPTRVHGKKRPVADLMGDVPKSSKTVAPDTPDCRKSAKPVPAHGLVDSTPFLNPKTSHGHRHVPAGKKVSKHRQNPSRPVDNAAIPQQPLLQPKTLAAQSDASAVRHPAPAPEPQKKPVKRRQRLESTLLHRAACYEANPLVL